MHRLIRCWLALGALSLAACGGGGGSNTPADNAKACSSPVDCTGTDVCINGACVPVCHSNSDCTSPQVCEEGQCQLPGCGSDSQCAAGQSCINGGCTASATASDVISCDVTPNEGEVRVGATLQLTAVSHDASGGNVRFHSYGWAVTSGTSVTVDASSGVVTGASNGDSTVTATVSGGSKTCSAIVHSYADAAAGRVAVIDMQSKKPIAGAKVVVDPPTSGPVQAALVTGADGTVAVPALTGAGAHDVHVFAAGYNYASFIQTTATDLLVPLPAYVDESLRSGFTAHVCDTAWAADSACSQDSDFKNLSSVGGEINVAFFGSGIPNSLLDLSIDTLVGPSHSVTIPYLKTQANLPYGLVVGFLGAYASADYRVYADPGERAIWGIGGNLFLNDVTPILSTLQGGTSNIDIGKVLPLVLPFLQNLQAGAVVGVKAPANGTAASGAGQPTFQSQPIKLDAPMRLRVDATSPKLPQLDGHYLDGVIAVVGAADYPIGFVPLGITAGLSANDGSGGVLDPTCDTTVSGTAGCDTGKLPIKFAPENGGTEGSKVGVALLAVNFGGLTPGSSTNIAISAQMKVADKIDYVPPPGGDPTLESENCNGAACGSFPAFLKLPASAAVTAVKSTRTLTAPADADSNVQVYRFEVANSARFNWYVWMGKTGGSPRSIVLPDPRSYNDSGSSALIDPLNDSAPTARLLGMQFTDGTITATKLETFKNSSAQPRIDEIGTSLQGFTALQVNVQ